MKVKTILKTVKALLVIIAFVFTTNSQAFSKHKNKNGQKYTKKYSKKTRQGGGSCGDKVPLDGGLSVLLLGAAAFGVKKLRGNKNEEI